MKRLIVTAILVLIAAGVAWGRGGLPSNNPTLASGASGPVCPSAPLDSIAGTPSIAVGVRKLYSAYAGKALQVSRSSDNTQHDVGFVMCSPSGTNLDVADMLSFCGVTTCTVAKWYDQSGAGHDLVDATPNTGPQIMVGGVLVATIGGRPAMQFQHAGTSSPLNTTHGLCGNGTESSGFAVANALGGSTGALGSISENRGPFTLWSCGDANQALTGVAFMQTVQGCAPCFDGWRTYDYWFNTGIVLDAGVTYTFGNDGIFLLRWKISDSPTLKTYIGGGSPATNATATPLVGTFGSTFIFQLSNRPTGDSGFYGNVSEMIIFASECSTSDANIIGANESTFFGPSWSNISF
jgi:hypothetical protein